MGLITLNKLHNNIHFISNEYEYRLSNDLLFIHGVSTHVNTAPPPTRKVKERLKRKDGEKGEKDNKTLLCANI